MGIRVVLSLEYLANIAVENLGSCGTFMRNQSFRSMYLEIVARRLALLRCESVLLQCIVIRVYT